MVSVTAQQIQSRGYWDVTVRPEEFLQDRVQYENLERIITEAVVRFRGWPVPMIDSRKPFLRGDDWIGQDIEALVVTHLEAWRFWTSGQFNQLRVIGADWREHKEATPVPAGFRAVIEVWEIVFFLTEIFELAARLALSPAGTERMVVEARIEGLADRGVIVGQSNRAEFIEPYRSTLPSQARSATLDRDVLVANPRLEAAKMAREFLMRFGWTPSIEQLIEHQRELTEGR